MPNYQNGKIYKIICNTTNKVYIGSTTLKYLSSRLNDHKQKYKKNINITSREVLENGNFNIFLVENYPCNSKDELLSRERYYIDLFDCVNLNKSKATEEEKKASKQKYEDKVKEKRNEIHICECGGSYSLRHLQRHLRTKKHLNFSI